MAAAILCIFAGTGCTGLTYDRQEKVFVFTKGRPEIKVLLVYEGLRVLGDRENSLKQAKEQLTELFVNRQEFWFGDGETPLHFSLRNPTEGPPARLQPLLKKHVTIDAVEFFSSADGRLCASQVLTVRDPQPLIDGLNEIISELVAEKVREEFAKPAAENNGKMDEDSLRLLDAASQQKFRWLRIDSGRFSLTIPASPALSRQIKSELLRTQFLADAEDMLRRQNGKDAEAATRVARARNSLDSICNVPWSFDQRVDRLTVSLGYGGDEPIRVSPAHTSSPPMTPLDKELIDFAHKLEVPFAARRESEAVVGQFLRNVPTGRQD
jgi:hypothetical protein